MPNTLNELFRYRDSLKQLLGNDFTTDEFRLKLNKELTLVEGMLQRVKDEGKT
jgi:hypothetical protein